MSALVSTLMMSLVSIGGVQVADDYIDGRVDTIISEHTSDSGHLAPYLLESIAYITEDNLSKDIDRLMKQQCNGADVKKEIKDKRKRYRKITGEVYPNKTCDELNADI